MGKEAEDCLKLLKNGLASATLGIIDKQLSFVIEPDATKNGI